MQIASLIVEKMCVCMYVVCTHVSMHVHKCMCGWACIVYGFTVPKLQMENTSNQ